MNNQAELIHCRSCGAAFDRSLVHCPYCGATNPEAAEQKYMEDLRGVRRELGDLRSLAKKETIAETREAGRYIRKVLMVTLLLAVVFGCYYAWQSYQADREDEKNYLWKRENTPVLDAYYENRQYDELLKFYYDSAEQDVPVWSWEHYRVLHYLAEGDQLRQILEEEKKGTALNKEDLAWVLLMELELMYGSGNSDLPEDEAAWVAEIAQPYLSDLQERFSLTEEETEHFMESATETSGYLDYDQCKEFISKRGIR